MRRITIILAACIIFAPVQALFSQTDSTMREGEVEIHINQALDLFSRGEYVQSIALLDNVLLMDPGNQRASDLKESIVELYKLELYATEEDTEQSYNGERPDFSIKESDEPENTEDEKLEKPDFSVRSDEDLIVHPEETRTYFELSLYPNLVLPWDIGEDSVVFPDKSGYSGSFNAKADLFLRPWDRSFGISGAYSLFMLDPAEGGFATNRLNVVDAMFTFRTFFSEEVDSKIIFKLGLGYRGYFSVGYNFYTVERDYLNGFNMGVNLEAPLLYLIWEREFLKRIILDLDMNLLFFPELSTLNLFDFKINTEFRFGNFSAGIHFGAYSVITDDLIEYMWMTGVNINFYF